MIFGILRSKTTYFENMKRFYRTFLQSLPKSHHRNHIRPFDFYTARVRKLMTWCTLVIKSNFQIVNKMVYLNYLLCFAKLF